MPTSAVAGGHPGCSGVLTSEAAVDLDRVDVRANQIYCDGEWATNHGLLMHWSGSTTWRENARSGVLFTDGSGINVVNAAITDNRVSATSQDLTWTAATAFRKQSHPTDADAERARYLVIYALDVHRHFQGVDSPAAPGQRYAATIMDALEELAHDRADCVGLSLCVREDNPRAIAFYERYGFIADPAGPVTRDEGPRHLTMRLLFDR